MRQISCVICNDLKTNVTELYSSKSFNPDVTVLDPYSGHYQINRCDRCGLIYSSPILDEADVNILYQKFTAKSNIVPGEEENARRTMKLYYELCNEYLKKKTRILDVGCDVGYLLEVAKKDGFEEIYGTEPNIAAAEFAERIPGAKISREFYEETHYQEKYFDLIALIHVLDHLYDPRITLKLAHDQLDHGGIIIAVVHNVKTILSFILGEKYPPFNFYHNYFFSKVTLRKLFETQGFEVIKVTPTYNIYSLGFLIRKIPVLPRSIINWLGKICERLGIHRLSIKLPLGNIAIIARRG